MNFFFWCNLFYRRSMRTTSKRFLHVRPTKIPIAPVGEINFLSNIRMFPRSSRILTHQSQPSVTICIVPRLFRIPERLGPRLRIHIQESNIIGPICPITDITMSYSESWSLFIRRERSHRDLLYIDFFGENTDVPVDALSKWMIDGL